VAPPRFALAALAALPFALRGRETRVLFRSPVGSA